MRVRDKVEMDSDRTLSSNVNVAECQNVLVDVLRSDNFALLCNVLRKTVHQDKERTAYFDFGVIDSRMKNGDYGHAPGLFKDDLKLLWDDLKMAGPGQDIIYLANSLSSFTEASYTKQVGKERRSGDCGEELKGALVASSEPKNLIESNTLAPSISQGFVQLDQPNPKDVSDVQRGSANTLTPSTSQEFHQLNQPDPIDISDLHKGSANTLISSTSQEFHQLNQPDLIDISDLQKGSANTLTPSTLQEFHQLDQADPINVCDVQNGSAYTLAPLTTHAFHELDQPDSVDVSDVQKGSTCNKCGKEARSVSTLTCNRCMLVCHISCIESPVSSLSTESWYCKNCSTTCNESAECGTVVAHHKHKCLHGNCVLCRRLEVFRPPECKEIVRRRAPVDNSRAVVISSVEPVEVCEVLNVDADGLCKICGNPEEGDNKFLICGHSHCLYKYYHIRCLKSKQIASDAQLDKPCWYCQSCLCRVCLSDRDDDLTILCDGCDEAYHLYCITPRRTSVPKGKWYCSSCSVERAEEGMRQYEKKMLRHHRKDDTRLRIRNFAALDLLLSAAEKLSADEQPVTCTE